MAHRSKGSDHWIDLKSHIWDGPLIWSSSLAILYPASSVLFPKWGPLWGHINHRDGGDGNTSRGSTCVQSFMSIASS